ncbi:hypothetical protein [Microseira sp. BLCC-F43]|uniref:hypothetical protein n=1 Tax=Microseira sp. BLCC-F43 TaxID=3153602 RepID=UPI0035B8DF0B
MTDSVPTSVAAFNESAKQRLRRGTSRLIVKYRHDKAIAPSSLENLRAIAQIVPFRMDNHGHG